MLVANLGATPALLRRLAEDASVDQAGQAPRPGAWSIAQVVSHLLDGDRDLFLPRLRLMLAEERPVFESRNPEPSADRSDLATLLDAFESARGGVVKILEGLDSSGWAREAVFSNRGAVTVEGYAAMMAGHDTEHLQQIHQVRSVLGLRPKRAEARVALALGEIVAAIQPVPETIAALCRGLSPDQLRRRPRQGEWSMKEVMAHFLKVERDLFLPRLRRIAEEDRPRFESFDPEAWAAERDHRQGDFMADWRQFAAARAETVAFLQGLPPAAGERLGLSGFFGPIILAAYATHIVDHDIEHLSQLGACRAVVGG